MFPFRTVVMLALCVVPSLVCGHITPTGPAVGTEIRGGEERVFEWNFDKEELDGNPFAHERFRCDLMWGKEHWVALLARNLSMYDNAVQLHFLPEYGSDSSAYYVRYMTYESEAKVYTERFTLKSMNGTNYSAWFEEYPDRDMSSHGSGGLPPANSNANPLVSSTRLVPSSSYTPLDVTPSLTQTTLEFPSTSATPSHASSQIGGPIGPFGNLPTPSAAEPSISGSRSGAMSLSRQRDSAWQKISLILWPVMVGAIMAV